MISYYFFKAILHDGVHRFVSKNTILNMSYWRSLFSYFGNIIVLNLALSCTDEILELISKHCPNVEHLNITSKYVTIRSPTNALGYCITVTDSGLTHLWKCQKLKKITMNEPRSFSKNNMTGITFTGIRNLLINIPSIEDITYSDLGKVLAKDMESVDSLNIRTIRHFNPTVESVREILRLCKNLNDLFITCFIIKENNEILDEIIKFAPKLKSLETVHLPFCSKFNEFFTALGENLIELDIYINGEQISFKEIITLGKCCPNLRCLRYCRICDENITTNRPVNFGQFSKLQNLFIKGEMMDIENILIFCSENAINLESVEVIDQGLKLINLDEILVKKIISVIIRRFLIKGPFYCTRNGLIQILEKYTNLENAEIPTNEDCLDILELYDKRYYNFNLITRNIYRRIDE